MKKVKILLGSGMNDSKAKKVVDEVKKNLKEKQICEADIIYVNLLQNKDVSKYEDTCDFAIAAGQNLNTKLKVINGRNLVYSFLGTDSVYEDIKKVVEDL